MSKKRKRPWKSAAERARREREELHRPLLELHAKRLDVATQLLRDRASGAIAAAQAGDELPGLALMMLVRATWAFQSVKRLFLAGFDLDAQSVLRPIPELLIDLKYIRLEPLTRIELFQKYPDIANWRRFQQLSKSFPALVADETPESISKRKEVHDAALPRYPHPRSWTKHDLSKRATEAKCELIYDLVYRTCCDATHSGPAAIQQAYDQIEETGAFSVTPPVPDGSFSVAMAVLAFTWLIYEVMECVGHTPVPSIEELAAELQEATKHELHRAAAR